MQKRVNFHELGQRLKQDKGALSQEKYAKALRIDQSTLSRLLRGEQSRLSQRVLERIAGRVDIPEVREVTDPVRVREDQELVKRAIVKVGGKAVLLCARLHFGASSVSEWGKGIRPIPKNERRRLEEFVNAEELPRTDVRSEDPIETFAAGYALNPELQRLRQLRPDLVVQEWEPAFQAALNQAKRERDEIMYRSQRVLDDRLRLLLKLAERRST